jgi:hypothetical protein
MKETVPNTHEYDPSALIGAQQNADMAENSDERRRRNSYLKDRLSDRARDLFRGLVRKIGRDRVDIVVEAHILEVAELKAACEALRLQMTTEVPTAALINSVTRLASTTARAERALFKAVPPKKDVPVTLRERLARAAAKRGGQNGEE